MSTETETEDTQALAVSFAGVAEEYERGRPGYPVEAVQWLLGEAPLDVLDLAAGTGKLTQAVLAAGHRVTAVEPLEDMRAVLARSAPGARVLEGKAEQIPLPDASVDAVVIGAAFHWFDQEVALKEIARVLRRPGLLGVLGNRSAEAEPWVGELTHVTHTTNIEPRERRQQAQRRLLESHFESVDEGEFVHEQLLDRARMQDLALSRSRLAVQDEQGQQAILTQIERSWEENGAGREQVPVRWHVHVLRARGVREAAGR